MGTSLLLAAAWGCGVSGEPERELDRGEPPLPQQQVSSADYAKDSVLVRFKAGAASRQLRANLLARAGGTMRDKNGDGIYDGYANLTKDGSLAKIDLDKTTSVEAALAVLRKDPSILYAEPNHLQRISGQKIAAIPNDARFAELYAMNNTGQTGGTPDADLDAVEAWNVTTGSHDIVVGVVDTGVDYTHPDLAGNMWTNPLETAGNGVDDDGNGVIDDVHGFNAITGGGDPMDDNDHGTHCSGTLGAQGNNGIGVAGVSWDVSIMALKFLSGAGTGTTADAIESIDYAVGRKNAGVNLRILSNSWGGGGFNQALFDAITAANAADILFVAAAGNAGSDNDATPSYPSGYDIPNVVAVANTDHNDALASPSNYGLLTVDLGAPGMQILSTVPGNAYATFSGSSMSTPHVAGTAALVLSVNSTLSTAELKDIVLTTGDLKPSLIGKTVTGRRVNAANAVAAAGTPGPRFGLSTGPASRTIAQNQTTTFDVGVTVAGGFTGSVALTATSTPALTGATLTFAPSSVTAPGASVLSVATSCTTAPGTYTLAITGTSGAQTRTRNVTLVVRAFGEVELALPSTDTPIAIPDNAPAGITSTLAVSQSRTISELGVEVNITHTFIGDLVVTLVAPGGQSFILHNLTGGATDNLHQTFAVPAAAGLGTAGSWQLKVADTAGLDIGTLDSWTLHALVAPGALPPTAAFTLTANRLAVQFTDASTDTGCNGGSIAIWGWGFGDGQTSTAQNPSHTYAAAGTYDVTLTVTDNEGNTGTITRAVTVTRPTATLSIERVVRNRATFEFSVDLTWSGLSGTLIDFYRSGLLVDIPANNGVKRDTFRRYETSFTWKVCEQQSAACSNEVSIVFGASADHVTVVTKDADGASVSRVLQIEDMK